MSAHDDYAIEFVSKRATWLPRWFPFNSIKADLRKTTDLADVKQMAADLSVLGAWDVQILKRR